MKRIEPKFNSESLNKRVFFNNFMIMLDLLSDEEFDDSSLKSFVSDLSYYYSQCRDNIRFFYEKKH